MRQSRRDILIVDDEAAIRDMAADVLTDGEHNYSVRTAADGAAALEMIRECPPALVLLDVNMPTMSGEELFVELRRGGSADIASLPILFMTASTNETTLLQRLSRQVIIGTVAVLSKPFDIDVLSRRVADYFTEETARGNAAL